MIGGPTSRAVRTASPVRPRMARRRWRHRREDDRVRHNDRDPVVVGYDGSRASRAALRWAAEVARLRNLPLAVCHAWRWPYPGRPSGGVGDVRRAAGHVLDEGLRRVSRVAGRPDATGRLVEGTAAGALVTQSYTASLVVVGDRGTGGFGDLRVGSVAVQVSAHASCPVVVVKDGAPTSSHRGDVVVGIDGSPASDAALGFAFEEAALRRAPVRVVCSWWDAGAAVGTPAIPFTDAAGLERDAAARFHRTVAPWLEKYGQVDATTAFVVEPPREALREAAVGARLVVVGNRGIGTAPTTLLGAMSRSVLHDATCPVAIVHAT